MKKISTYTRKLGYNIMCIRVDKGISLPTVSDALNISVYVLKNIEAGKYPSLRIKTLFHLASYYKLSVKDLYKDR